MPNEIEHISKTDRTRISDGDQSGKTFLQSQVQDSNADFFSARKVLEERSKLDLPSIKIEEAKR